MAAEILSGAGHSVVVADAMPSVGRKLLMAGKSGLNLTKAEPLSDFLQSFCPADPVLRRAVTDFGPAQVVDWAQSLGQPVFTGSTGRVFPTVMKASPLLRAWLARLAAQGVQFRHRWRWTGFGPQGAEFATPDGPATLAARATILALGGASWRRLGSDGAWAAQFPDHVAPFAPANVGLVVDWSPHMATHFGQPVKAAALHIGDRVERGEFVVSSAGLEGGGIYALGSDLRAGLALTLDLFPDLTVDHIRSRIVSVGGAASLANRLRKALGLGGVRAALLQEWGRPLPQDIAPLLKSLPAKHAGPRPIDQAISVAGGLRFDALDDTLMLRDRPGVFAAGEMLDWEAPTGGYLITGCLATGRLAGLGAAAYLARG
ncbi:MAG: TIGR03862 family flavoprotein [Rhodobacteraceae bacterium]|nr:TIGR03862 family flavoprotein [Paracoccaceae bacterium]